MLLSWSAILSWLLLGLDGLIIGVCVVRAWHDGEFVVVAVVVLEGRKEIWKEGGEGCIERERKRGAD